jgi:hypothetical protein
MQLRGLRIKKFSVGAEKDRVKFFLIATCIKVRAQSVIVSRILKVIVFVLASAIASAQVEYSAYLLRLEHTTSGARLCVLLKRNGFFHLESDNGDSTKVSEGLLGAERLGRIQRELKDKGLQELSQSQIEEPLNPKPEFLQIDTLRDDHWQALTFFSAESQQPYRRSLDPLIRWLDDLHKAPHKELSEDAGKNNCLPPRKIALKKRGEEAPHRSAELKANPARVSPTKAPVAEPDPTPALLRVSSMGVKSHVIRQTCFLVIANGFYRAEEREQKEGGRTIKTKITGGKFAPEEVSQLQQLLNDPAIAEIHHRKTSRMVLSMSGEMLNLQIPRPPGVQDVVLSSTFNRRDVPFFYSGDGDISSAQPLLKFFSEHVWTAGSGRLDPSLRNDCQSAP